MRALVAANFYRDNGINSEGIEAKLSGHGEHREDCEKPPWLD
jgi:hypothetical protein